MMKANIILLLGGIVFTSEIVWQLCKRLYYRQQKENDVYRSSEKNTKKPKKNISEVMFFSKDSVLCRAHINATQACSNNNCPIPYLRKLEGYMNNAERTLDVCMYILTCESLSEAIVNAHKRGVLVRIIMDKRMANNDSSRMAIFRNNGIALRMQIEGDLMHHKFVIVDEDILISGSTNWTVSAFFGNYDNLLVSNQSSLVKPFVEEFEKLWKAFEVPTSV